MSSHHKFGCFLTVVAALSLSAGCDDEFELDDADIGVGMSLEIDIEDGCSLCSSRWVEVLRVLDKVPGIFEIEETSATTFTLTALRQGSTRISVAARNTDDTVDIQRADFTAHEIDSFILELRGCPRYREPEDPVLVVAGVGATFKATLRSPDGVDLQGTAPIDNPETYSYRGDRLTLVPDQPGIVTVRSPIIDSDLAVLDVRDASEVDGLLFTQVLARPVPAGYETTVEIMPTLGGQTLCEDSYERSLTISTPTVCEWSGAAAPELATTEHLLEVRTLAAGTCTIEAAIDELALATALSFEVTP
ncbi:MAG: hypothetical protein KJO07_06610 [Deltaproteobacteria bacterium]|nr:hypothetical protein [Deltaproteobacteria bacterium]